MTQIQCRICQEPYDCTGGLHYTHTDLNAWEFEQFIKGYGCPCCQGELDYEVTEDEKADRTNAWARSLQGATDETVPYPNFYDQLRVNWQTGLWIDEPPSLKEVLAKGLYGLDPDALSAENFDSGESALWYQMGNEHYNDDRRDMRGYTNYVWVTGKLGGPSCDPLPYRYSDDGLEVKVATRSVSGRIAVNQCGIFTIVDAEKILSDSPLLDEDAFNQMEHEAAEESLGYVFDHLAGVLNDAFGWDCEGLAMAWLTKFKDDIVILAHERDDRGYEQPEYVLKEDEHDLLCQASAWCTLPGYEIFKAAHAENVWLVASNLSPRSTTVSGLLVRHGGTLSKRGEIWESEVVTGVPAHEFGYVEMPPRDYYATVELQRLPPGARVEVLRALKEAAT